MNKKTIILTLFIISGCTSTSNHNLSSLDLLVKGSACFDNSKRPTEIHTTPTRGYLADKLAISSPTDGGFTERLNTSIESGITQFIIYSENSNKLINYLEKFLDSNENSDLENIKICYVGDKPLPKNITLKIEKTKVKFKKLEL